MASVYPDQKFNEYYDTILSSLQGSAPQVQYNMPDTNQLTAQIASYLRPKYDQAIANRQQQTLQNRAATDVDAASRGMGSSTWVTDVKNKGANAEYSDIANLESNYGAQLSEALLNQYNQALSNKLNVDMQNAQMSAQYEKMAYDRAADMYSLTSKKSGRSRSKPKSEDVEELLAELSMSVGSNTGKGYIELGTNKNYSDKYSSKAIVEARQYLADSYSTKFGG